MKKVRSFLKWAGSKHRCLEHILPEFPEKKRLVEPFFGSGVVFANTNYRSYLLAEENVELVNLFKQLKSGGDDFIAYCRSYFIEENNCSDQYYHFRHLFNSSSDARERAALFMYLNRYGYNGLCRFNQRGGYNVPFGRYARQRFPLDEMQWFYSKSKQAIFLRADFRETFLQAEVGDLIYCDPPYSPIDQESNFSSYVAKRFQEQDHIDLATLARQSAEKGITVIISNHDTKFTRALYDGAEIKSFEVARFISSKVRERKPVKELMAVFKS